VLLASKEEKAKWLRQQEVTWSLATRLFLTGETYKTPDILYSVNEVSKET